MRRAVFCTFFSAGLLLPALGAAQMVTNEESRARRGCIDEARRDGWDVRSVSGFRARQEAYTVFLQVERSRQLSQVSCAWDGRRARIDVTDDPWLAGERGGGRSADGDWQRGDGSRGWPGDDVRSAVDACELALLDEVRREARRRGETGGDAFVEDERTAAGGRSGEDVISGTGSYRFGSERYRRMTFECRVDSRTRRVTDVRWDPDGRDFASRDDGTRATGARPREGRESETSGRYRRLTCAASGREERTCSARIAGDVRLVRRDAGSCSEGRDWWWRPEGITVRNGCRALFEYEAER